MSSEKIVVDQSTEKQVPSHKHRGYVGSLLSLKCNRCREGDMFQTKSSYKKGFMKMNETCPVCGQPTEIETGFYYGTGYVSYALAVAVSVASFIAWYVLIGFSYSDNRFIYWIISNAVLLIVLQPYIMRLSRVVWFSFFVSYNKNWRQEEAEQCERAISDFKNAW